MPSLPDGLSCLTVESYRLFPLPVLYCSSAGFWTVFLTLSFWITLFGFVALDYFLYVDLYLLLFVQLCYLPLGIVALDFV